MFPNNNSNVKNIDSLHQVNNTAFIATGNMTNIIIANLGAFCHFFVSISFQRMFFIYEPKNKTLHDITIADLGVLRNYIYDEIYFQVL